MTYAGFPESDVGAACDAISRAGLPDFAWKLVISCFMPTRFPLGEQSSSDEIQIRQRRRHFRALTGLFLLVQV